MLSQRDRCRFRFARKMKRLIEIEVGGVDWSCNYKPDIAFVGRVLTQQYDAPASTLPSLRRKYCVETPLKFESGIRQVALKRYR